MSPSAEPAGSAVASPAAATLLSDGEVVILAFRPSPWFAMLVSWQVLAVAAVVVLLAFVARESLDAAGIPLGTLTGLCAAAALARLGVGCFQWLSRFYVLTNLRVIRLRGLVRPDVFHCPLRHIREVTLTGTRAEGLLGLGTLCFHTAGAKEGEACWINIARPTEVHRTVLEAISRAR